MATIDVGAPKLTVRERLIKTLGGGGVFFKGDLVDLLERRVQKKVKRRTPEKKSNPLAVAYFVAYNWALNMRRKQASLAKKQAKKLLKLEKQRREGEIRKKCRIEFDRIARKLRPELVRSQPEQIKIARLMCFGGLTGKKCDRECDKKFPNISYNLRIAWKIRAIKLVLPYASLDLATFLAQSLNQRCEKWFNNLHNY